MPSGVASVPNTGRACPPRRAPTGSAPNGRPPLVLCWGGPRPLPVRPVRALTNGRARPRVRRLLPTGPLDQPFDFSGRVHLLCADITARCPELSHIDMGRVLVGVMQAQRPVERFAGAGDAVAFSGRQPPAAAQGHLVPGAALLCGLREMLYLMTFCLPRFLDRDFDDKFVMLSTNSISH